MRKWTLLTAFLALVLVGGACNLAEKPGKVTISAPTPGLLGPDGEYWYGLRNWIVSGPVEIWPDTLHNVDSFCVIRRGGWIRHTGPTCRVIHADTISLAGNSCYLTNFSWWTGARMNFTLKLMSASGAVLLQTSGVVIGDYYTQINVHNFTAPVGVTNYELTYWTEQDSAMVDGCVLRQYPNQQPPPPPPPAPDTVWTLPGVQLAKNQTVRYYRIPTYGHASLRLTAQIAGQLSGNLAWSNGTNSNFSARTGAFGQTFAVPSGATHVTVILVGKGRSGATVTSAALFKP